MSFLPQPAFVGRGLVVRYQGRTDIPSLIVIREFFGVTGAKVQMAGVYGLRRRTLDFRGDVRLDAPVSKMVTGVKSWLLRPFDPLFRKQGAGTRVAIKVEGTTANPKFGIELGRTLRGQ